MYLLCVLLNVLAPAADADADARAALAFAVAATRPSYESLRARAIAEGRPLVVWVGVRRPDLERPDWLHYHCESFPGATPPCAVVGRPADGGLWRSADVPANGVTAGRLAAAASSPAPVFFPRPTRCGPGGCW